MIERFEPRRIATDGADPADYLSRQFGRWGKPDSAFTSEACAH